ncbi:MAG TPA: type 4a pilus biogenesis protein PilO [Planctomycetota bacterium]|nr:type 4a pilus biogenesis protein PilO [Planctomycetota bacterium]
MALGIPQDPAQQKKLLGVIVPLLAAFLYWNFVHKKQVEEITTMQERLEELETSNRAARAKAASGGAELERKLATYRAHIDRLEQLIPLREQVPELLRTMAQNALETGVDLKTLRPAEDQPGQFYTKQVYEFGATGAYHDLGEFMTSIGSLPRIVTTTDLTLQPTKGTTRTGEQELEAKFNIETYVIPEKPLAPPPTDSADAKGKKGGRKSSGAKKG